MKNAVILLSGGLDSATTLAMARAEGYGLYTLSFAYGQRHAIELEAAKQLAEQYGVRAHHIIPLALGELGGSALTDDTIAIPKHRSNSEIETGIPATYVPARNTLFLSYALALAEVIKSYDIFIGVNAVDYSGYPDCRPAFIESFEKMANLATAYATESGQNITIHTPLIHYTKAEIIQAGQALGVDYSRTVSCYDANIAGEACGACDSCILRKKGFAEAGIADPTRYISKDAGRGL